jgi:4-amino-4-deoxy-L-arabinose transferase-like glycosyltransferase
MIVLGILLGAFVYRWSKELFGFEAAVASLCVYCLDPNILAHSQIVQTDMPFATFSSLAAYFFCRALDKLSWRNLILPALFFGLAAITKYHMSLYSSLGVVLDLLKIFSAGPQECTIGRVRSVSSRWGKDGTL